MTSIEQFYNETVEQVFGYVISRVRNQHAAEDIVSEAFLKVVEHFDDFKPRAHASRRSWLFAIVRNTITDTYRLRSQMDIELTEDLHRSDAHELDRTIDVSWEYAAIMKHLDVLSERQREILLLRYKAELKNKEIAELLAVDERTVSATLSKAITVLRNELSR